MEQKIESKNLWDAFDMMALACDQVNEAEYILGQHGYKDLCEESESIRESLGMMKFLIDRLIIEKAKL